MNQGMSKAIVQGAMITAIYGILAMINLYTGSLFDILLLLYYGTANDLVY